MGWLVFALCAVGLVGFYVVRDWRRGQGYYEPYGPRSSGARRGVVDEARRLRNDGLSEINRALRMGRDREPHGMSRAVAALRQSASWGDAGAKTGLGIVSYLAGDLDEACTRWLDALSGDDAARLLLMVARGEAPGQLDAVIRTYLDSQTARSHERRAAMQKVAVHADAAGLRDFAAELRRKAERPSYGG